MSSGLEDERARHDALSILRSGGIVVLPTDTVPGLSGAASAMAAITRISQIKGRAGDRTYILIADSINTVGRYVSSFGCIAKGDLGRIWPAPVTGVFPAGSACPPWVDDTVAFRVPAHERLRDLIGKLGEPIVSTSVNRHGDLPLTNREEITDEFGKMVDLVITDTESAKKTESTIVDFTGTQPRVIRAGSYAWAAAGDSNPSK